MIIGVDIRMLSRGTRAGVQEYLINLLGHLPTDDRSVEYRLFYNGWRKVKLDFPWLHCDNVVLYPFSFPNRLVDFSVRFFNSPKIDRLIGGADVFFSPHFFSAPLSAGVKKVTTFHDLSFEREPRFFSFRQRLWHWQVQAKKVARNSARIIAVSNSTKQDLVNLYGIKPERISVVYSGIDPGFRPLPADVLASEKSRLQKKYGLPDDFVLYLGTIEPRKNIIGIIRAFGLLKQQKRYAGLELVLAGSFGWLFGDILKAWRVSPCRDAIKFLGFVADGDKIGLYNLAKIFVYPSFFEGFGFPPLEAMACGVPAIVSNTSSLPEVAGDAAVLVDPYKIDEIYSAMRAVLGDERLYRRLQSDGIGRAGQFRWDRCSRQTLSVFKG